jgi:outer membrane protein
MKKIILATALAAILVSCDKQKTGFVNTETIVKEYKEMSDTQELYAKKNDEMSSALDIKIQEFQIKADLYQKNGPSMNRSEREKKEEELMMLRQQIQQEQQTGSRQLQQESQAAIDSVIKKVKARVKEYGEKNGYDYIYGQNDAGSVMFGKAEYDLTDEVLKELNDNYTPVSTEK